MRDMNRPKSWTAGIWRWRGRRDEEVEGCGTGQAWSPGACGLYSQRHSGPQTNALRQDEEALAAGMAATGPGGHRKARTGARGHNRGGREGCCLYCGPLPRTVPGIEHVLDNRHHMNDWEPDTPRQTSPRVSEWEGRECCHVTGLGSPGPRSNGCAPEWLQEPAQKKTGVNKQTSLHCL